MGVVLVAVSAVVGLALGGLLGYLLGRRVVEDRLRFWWCAAGIVSVCVVADYAGIVTGRGWLAIGSLCAMAGGITGLKYGGVQAVRMWEKPATVSAPPAEQAEAPASDDTDAS